MKKPISFVLCLNFSIETKIKTLFLTSYFNLSKKRNDTLGTRIGDTLSFPFDLFVKETNRIKKFYINITGSEWIAVH